MFDYVGLINFIFGTMFSIMGLLTAHFIIFAIIGLFARKTFPKADKQLKYGIIIPARNEEAVVGNLIKSIQNNKYPQDKLHIFLIAHNCTDKTAEIGRQHGVTVYEYNNTNECTMGYAFRYLFDRIREDYGIENYDGFFLFNADNICDDHFFDKMNDAFVAEKGDSVITSCRNSKNFGSNLVSAMYGLYFVYGCRFEARGRSALGCSTRVQGTGYVINSELVKNGWQYVTLTEDWEFTADQILRDKKIVYCDEAMFYDEQPTSLRVMWRQRLRWARGHLLVCTTRFKDILKGLFRKKKNGGTKNKISTYDIMVNIMPVCVIGVAISLGQAIALCFSPLFGRDIVQVLLAFLVSLLQGIGSSYLLAIFASIIIYIVERKRLPKTNILIKIFSILLFPAFVLVSVPAEVVALFAKNLGWKAIPHTDTTDFEELHSQQPEEGAETEAEAAVSTDVAN